MTKLAHVIKLESVPVENLSGLKPLSLHSCSVPSSVKFTEINIIDLVDVKMDDAIENKEKVYTSVVSFQTPDKIPSSGGHLAFRLTTIDGNRFLLGTSQRPYPIIKESNPFPGKVGDSTMKTVTVTWKSTSPLLYIVD